MCSILFHLITYLMLWVLGLDEPDNDIYVSLAEQHGEG